MKLVILSLFAFQFSFFAKASDIQTLFIQVPVEVGNSQRIDLKDLINDFYPELSHKDYEILSLEVLESNEIEELIIDVEIFDFGIVLRFR